jgi:hypothetical protein
MEAILTRKDFYLRTIKENENGHFAVFSNSDVDHRFGGRVKDGKLQIRPQSCGNPCKEVRNFDNWVRALNYSLTKTRAYSYSNSVLEFTSIETANLVIDNIFDVIEGNEIFTILCDHILSIKSTLPKGIIALRSNDEDSYFKFYKVEADNNFKITLYDFEAEYLKNHKSIDDLYHYDFKAMQVVANLECKTWVKN